MSPTTITLVFCLGGITFLVNWMIFLLLNQKNLENTFLGISSQIKTFLIYILISTIGVISMGIVFVSALMISHG